LADKEGALNQIYYYFVVGMVAPEEEEEEQEGERLAKGLDKNY
jgi:hypothetical protein